MHDLAWVPPGDYADGVGIAMGFIIVMIVTVSLLVQRYEGKLTSLNPFGPLIRWFDRWQDHHYRMAELKLRMSLKRDDPDYYHYLEEADAPADLDARRAGRKDP